MSTKVTASNGVSTTFAHKRFICDTEDDILMLPKEGVAGTNPNPPDDMANRPCSIGSTALVCSTSETWILAPSNQWVKLSMAGSGGGSGSDDSDESNVVLF